MEYKKIVFIDTNVILQGNHLSSLPWGDIDTEGPILVLVTPTVIREVDSKKTDGRLGSHARSFNSLLRPLLEDKDYVNIRGSKPIVNISMAQPAPIKWEDTINFDQNDPDSRIIAEILHTKHTDPTNSIFISQDFYPLALAKQHGLTVRHLKENWLRQQDKSTAEKRIKALEKEVEFLKSSQPNIDLEWGKVENPIPTIQVQRISDQYRKKLLNLKIEKNPIKKQDFNSILSQYNVDHSLQYKYEKWSKEDLPNFFKEIEEKIELIYNQHEISLTIKNTGHAQADFLLLKITANGGWLHDKIIYVKPLGPSAPQPTSPYNLNLDSLQHNLRLPEIPQRHEVFVSSSPDRSKYIELSCEDFRPEDSYIYTLRFWADPNSTSPLKLSVTATAKNFPGSKTTSIILDKKIDKFEIKDLIDINKEKYIKDCFVLESIKNIKGPEDASKFDFDS